MIENYKSQITSSDKKIIVCPPFTLLSMFKEFVDENALSIELGAQNISQFDEGAYTGEVNGRQIKEFADYVIIGHSERRSNLNETDEILSKKVLMAKKYGLVSVFCVQNGIEKISDGIEIVAYEPVFAIGTGNPDTPENAQNIAQALKKKGVEKVLYGGSVDPSNIRNFTSQNDIDGVLVGAGSLDPKEFAKIIQNA